MMKYMSDEELLLMLQKARFNNERLGVTGLLLYNEGNVLQVLEGERLRVQALYAKIQKDCRHTRVFTLSDGPVSTRTFSEWSMGFHPLSGHDFDRLIGYLNPQRADFLDVHLPCIDEALLDTLKSFVLAERVLI